MLLSRRNLKCLYCDEFVIPRCRVSDIFGDPGNLWSTPTDGRTVARFTEPNISSKGKSFLVQLRSSVVSASSGFPHSFRLQDIGSYFLPILLPLLTAIFPSHKIYLRRVNRNLFTRVCTFVSQREMKYCSQWSSINLKGVKIIVS